MHYFIKPLVILIFAGQQLANTSLAGEFRLVAKHQHAFSVNEPIKEIVKYNNALYLGYGNQERNEIAPLDVCHFRLTDKQLHCDFTFGTSEIRNFKIINNQLHIPATDPAETVSYDGYAIYDANTNQWQRISAKNFIEDQQLKHDWLVHAVDVAKYKDELWLIDTGGYAKHTHLNRRYGHYSGDIYRSKDGGQNWLRSNIGHSLNYSLFVFKDKLYSPSPVSSRGRYKKRQTMVYDGNSWQVGANFILPKPKPEIRMIFGKPMGVIFRLGQQVERGILDHLRIFKGHALVLQALHGAHLNRGGNPVIYSKHIGNILTASDDLSKDMENDNIVLGDIDKMEFVNDYCISDGKVYALMSDGEIRYSDDLENWKKIDTKFTHGHPYSIEVLDGQIFIGSNNGHLYQYHPATRSLRKNIQLRNR